MLKGKFILLSSMHLKGSAFGGVYSLGNKKDAPEGRLWRMSSFGQRGRLVNHFIDVNGCFRGGNGKRTINDVGRVGANGNDTGVGFIDATAQGNV